MEKNKTIQNPHKIEGSHPFWGRKTVTVRNTDEPHANARLVRPAFASIGILTFSGLFIAQILLQFPRSTFGP